MIQLTTTQREELCARAAARPELVQSMRESVQTLMDEPVLVPTSGVANWGLYYYCPKCSVALTFNRHDGKHHRCPQCGEVYTGEPYDGSWWENINKRNCSGAVTLGWLYVMTGDRAYAQRARDILVAYGKNYPNYEVHGNIPYNGPGRAGAQTLDEANFQRQLAMAFDLVSETMTAEEITLVRDSMFLPGAEFLVERRHAQLHNHEVFISSAIAMIGLLFDREDLIDFAVYSKYGLVYQLEKGMLCSGMWFEGSFGYHFYALIGFMSYEKFALHTKHSHIHHPNYAKMMTFPFDYVMPDGTLPMLGDTNFGHRNYMYDIYEFVYRELRDEKMLYMLHRAYKDRPRDGLEAVIYGVSELPPCPQIALPAAVHPQPGESGHTILRAKDERYLLFKHDRYGGEHDHYDRLGLSYVAYGKAIAPDMGTTGYGAVLHYDYYKNTGSHNLVVIGEENQPPANAVLTRFEEKDGVTLAEAVCDFTAPYQMPDSFTIVQWDEEAYKTVRMRRTIAWTQDYFAECFRVDGVTQGRTIDWVWHDTGVRVPQPGETPIERFSEKKPFKHIHDVTSLAGDAAQKHVFVQEDFATDVYSMAFGGKTLAGAGPYNPSYLDMSYLIERVCEPQATFAHVVETHRGEAKIAHVAFAQEGGVVRVTIAHADGSAREIEF